MATTTDRKALLAEMTTLMATEIMVETNEGTYGPQEARMATGSGEPKHNDYRVYERVGGGRRTEGCDPNIAPGRGRSINRDDLAAKRARLAELRRLAF